MSVMLSDSVESGEMEFWAEDADHEKEKQKRHSALIEYHLLIASCLHSYIFYTCLMQVRVNTNLWPECSVLCWEPVTWKLHSWINLNELINRHGNIIHMNAFSAFLIILYSPSVYSHLYELSECVRERQTDRQTQKRENNIPRHTECCATNHTREARLSYTAPWHRAGLSKSIMVACMWETWFSKISLAGC